MFTVRIILCSKHYMMGEILVDMCRMNVHVRHGDARLTHNLPRYVIQTQTEGDVHRPQQLREVTVRRRA